ncbi:nicotinate-nucleotide pyrophosphorylase [carboxylating] [Breznakibacter xylanolyticus]|uniref:Probable nicotinate-nucleotide pyrophosphorylase [carboxylating] n=1 Tax=Breznakibacter xylanolyticus TaxID=990 RepID=A0A2W7P177_9BACT|nr:carboxylating nicotinate-nucleotide diphosphorylase [Breznakibacter xylanolyticus]PZX19186.1 nicotinate-nucleotide pyrophosphorylase [carboxylating] [Breznakibacter xylanolyticus]
MNKEILAQIIDFAVREDIGDGDHSSLACIPEEATGRMHLLVKETGILAGVDLAQMVFGRIDPFVKFKKLIADGTSVNPGDIAFTVEGKVHSLLKSERLVLNIMQRMSGIATVTRTYADRLQGLKTRVLDTRKTTPGVRMLEKEAVRIGGGVNHRMGLYDMIMLKDNHIDFAGGIEKAILTTKKYLKETERSLKIEVETRNFDELEQVLTVGGIDRIMFDNFTPEQTREAVARVAGRFETESSGNITLDTIRDYAECGVDYVSVGALTHQIKSLDLSLKAIS